jgi:hypothetical protein
LANAYEVKKPSEELLELAKYAKYHIPEEHEKVCFIFKLKFIRLKKKLKI